MAPQAEEQQGYRLQVNHFRSRKAEVQRQLVQAYELLKTSFRGGAGADLLALHPDADASVFVDNDKDWIFEETRHGSNQGRIGIPSIGTHAPLALEMGEPALLWGFCHITNPTWMDQEGQTTVLGHRILTKPSGMYFAEQVKEKDPFFIDDYLTGKRYVYSTRKIEYLPVYGNEDVVTEVAYNIGRKAPVDGKSALVITCHPLFYNSSDERILIYGKQVNVLDIPEDDKYYLEYKTKGY